MTSMDRRHIIVVLEATLGGTRKYCADLLRHIDVKAFRVTFIYSLRRADENFASDLSWMRERGIELVEIPMSREVSVSADVSAFVSLFRYFRRHRYDLVHAHSSKAGFLARLASKLARPSAKTVYQPHMMAFWIAPWYLYVERFAALFTDLIIADSGSERRTIVERRVAGPDKVRTVNAGIELAPGSGGNDPERPVAAGRPFTVGAVARLSYPKDPFTFIRAAEVLRTRGRNVRFVWVGDGDLMQKSVNLVRDRGLQDVVEFVGWKIDVLRWIDTFDLFIHSSEYESFGYVLAEAMSRSKPVIASNVTGVVDLVEAGVTGHLFSYGDAEGLADRVATLADDPMAAAEMGRAGRRRVEQLFTVERMVADIQNVYHELCSGRPYGRERVGG